MGLVELGMNVPQIQMSCYLFRTEKLKLLLAMPTGAERAIQKHPSFGSMPATWKDFINHLWI